MIDDLPAAVARLRKTQIGGEGQLADIRIVLAALEAAQSGPPREPTRAMKKAGTLALASASSDRQTVAIGVWIAMHDAWQNEQTGGKAMPATGLSSPDHAGTAGPPDHQPAMDNTGANGEFVYRPAADPIADLCAELSATHCSNENLHDNAAYELERLARERDKARAERDALRAVVRAADYMRTREEHSGSSPGCVSCAAIAAYDAARAKVKGTI